MLKFLNPPVPEQSVPPGPALAGIVLPLAVLQLPLPWPDWLPASFRILTSSLLALGFALLALHLSGNPQREAPPSPDAGEQPKTFSLLWKNLLLLEAGTALLHAASMKLFQLLAIPFEKEQELVVLLKMQEPFHFSVMAAPLIAAVPVCEEVMFRYFLYGLLRRKTGVRTAAAVQAAIFAALHFTPVVFLPLFFFGLMQERCYLKTGRLEIPIMLHILFNALTVLTAFFG